MGNTKQIATCSSFAGNYAMSDLRNSIKSLIIRTLTYAVVVSFGVTSRTTAAEQPSEIVQMVRERVTANYAPVKTIQAKVVQEIRNLGRENPVPVKRGGDGKGARLTVSRQDRLECSVLIAGTDERYEWPDLAGSPKIRLRRGGVELDFVPGHYAHFYAFVPKHLTDMQCDPREAMFVSRADTVESVLGGEIRQAEFETQDGEKIARITSKGASNNLYIVECAEEVGYLPTQIYWINDSDPARKGVVQYGMSVEYSGHIVDGKMVQFPRLIFCNNAGIKQTTSTEGFMQLEGSQKIITTIKDLKLNEALPEAAFAVPDIPAETRISSQIDGDLGEVPQEIRQRVEQAEDSRRSRKSLDNTKRIIIAIAAYWDNHDLTLPPAFTSREGKPLLSWRVAILPYLDQKALYDEFRLDEPWDSQHNKKLLFKMPEVFRSPASKSIGPRTSYLTPRGATTAFPGEKAIKLTDILDGTANTVALVEVDDDRTVPWTAPNDWAFDVDHPKAGLGHLHRKGFCVAMFDGSAHLVPTDYAAEHLKGIVTIGGKEPNFFAP